MAITADANGSQTFQPDNYSGGLDILGLGHPRGYKPTTRGPVRPRFSQPQQVGPNLWRGKVTWFYSSGAIRQEDDLVNSLGEVAGSDIISDDWNIGRHAFMTKTDASAPDPNSPDRVAWADFHAKGQHVIGFYDPGSTGVHDKIYVEDPATGLMTASAYTPFDSHISGLLCMTPIKTNGSDYLALGWAGNSSGVDTLELVDKLSGGYASLQYPVGENATWGIVQSPVAGTPVLAYNGSRIAAIRAGDVPVASATVTNMLTGVPEGGYCVGLVSFSGTGYAVWAVPQNGTSAFFNPTALALGAGRLKLILTDLYGFYVSELNFPLPFIRYVNIVNGGLFACDGHTHYYYKGIQYQAADYIAADANTDWAANSDRDKVCRGHAVQNDRALWVLNEVASQHGTGATRPFYMEYNTTTGITRQISQAVETLSLSGELTVGGPSQPLSSYTNLLHTYLTNAYASGGSAGAGDWYSQYQPPAGILGFNQRKTVGASAGSGQEFEAFCQYRSTAYLGYPGFEGCLVAGANLKGPPTRHIAAGGAGARIIVQCAGASATFSATEPSARPAVRRIDRATLPWTYDLQLYVQSFRATTGVDPTRYTTNIFPISADVFIQSDDPPSIPANAGRMDRSRSRHK